MRIPLKQFSGMQPRLEPHLLPAAAAVDAVDVILERGSLIPLRRPLRIKTLPKARPIRSIYRFGKDVDDDSRFWFHWTQDTDVTRGPIPDDTTERTYFTEPGKGPQVTDASMGTSGSYLPSASFKLGVPAPSGRPGVIVIPASAPSEPSDEGDDELPKDPVVEPIQQSCVLVYTFVSAWGEEGAPSEVSDPFDAADGDTISVHNMMSPPGGNVSIPRKRLYVAVTDNYGSATLRFWAEVSAGATTYSAPLNFITLAEALPEFSMIPPPDNLFGIMSHPAGFLVGFVGQQVYRSEVMKPYGWPHFSPVSHDIVGGAVMGQSTVICTKGDTYIATQSDPLTFTPLRLEGYQPCVSKRSIKAFQGGVLYASPDGLVMVDPNGRLSVITSGILTREQWQRYKPESMHAAVHDSRYYCWYENGAEKGCLILDATDGDVVMTRSSIFVTAAYSDHRRDELFVALENGDLCKWNAGPLVQLEWTGRTYILERPQNLGAVQVVADAYPLIFELDAVVETDTGPRTIHISKTIHNGRPVRMDGSYRARTYSYSVKSTSVVREITIASTLANVTAE